MMSCWTALGTTAMARFDQMMPVRMLTWSFWIMRSAIWTASSGAGVVLGDDFDIVGAGHLERQHEPSRASMPRPAPPPESVVIMPTLMSSAKARLDTPMERPTMPAVISFFMPFTPFAR
jgi:hypothetical protein